MQSIVLITDKLSKERFIMSFSNEKEIAITYSPRMYFNEVLERVRDNVDDRIKFWCGVYGIKENVKFKRRRPKGMKYNTNPEASKRKSEWMKANNPSFYSWNDERKEKLSSKMKGNRFACGPKSDEWKQWMSEWMSQYKCVKGYKWIYCSERDVETRIPPHTLLPDGFRYGRSYDVMEAFRGGNWWY